MRKLAVIVILWLLPLMGYSQYYPNIVSYSYRGTPTSGVRIKTNIPFTNAYAMPLVKIQGYNFGTGEVLDLSIVWYIYNDKFDNYSVSSSGGAVPAIKLSNEGGNVSIHLEENVYYQRFYVSGFGTGMQENSSHFSNWTVVRGPASGSSITEVPYKNKFAGRVNLPEGIWDTDGKVGIGTTKPDSKLAVNGNIRAKEIKLETSNWPDYVFDGDYELMSLEELQVYIAEHGHLPGLKSAQEYQMDGVNMMEMNQKLLEKIEELTLHLIIKEGEINELKALSNEIELIKAHLNLR